MKLSAWAKLQGISYKTAHRWFQAGTLPVPSEQMPTGTIIVYPNTPATQNQGVAVYARVSSSDQKPDLDRQLDRMLDFATKNKLSVLSTTTEIGSGMNGHRPKLIKLLADPSVKTILVEHRDRLARFGVEYIEAAMKASGKKLVVMDAAELKSDLVQDMVDVLTSFCARLYGQRSAKHKADAALKVIQQQ